MDQRDYWDRFYAQSKIEEPSSFAIWVGNQTDFAGKHLVDWGCGSGRDGLYLAKFMDKVTLIDNSEVAIQNVNRRISSEKLTNAHGLVEDIHARELKLNNVGQTLLHYARFFLHAIDDQGLLDFIQLISTLEAAIDTRLAVFEYRILDSHLDLEYVYGNHERWLRSPEFVTELMTSAGWQLKNEIVGRDLAVFHEERPLVVRQTFSAQESLG